MKINTLRSYERLKHYKDFQHLFSNAKYLAIPPITFIYCKREKIDSRNCPILFGVSVPKYLFKKAVDRNRIKRQLREAYRIQKKNWLDKFEPNQTLILATYKSNTFSDFKTIENSITQCLQKIQTQKSKP